MVGETGIVGYRAPRAFRHAESHEVQPRPNGALIVEERRIDRIGAGITALDIVDAERVQRVRNDQLVLERQVDAVRLRAVAQGGVVQVQTLGHTVSLPVGNVHLPPLPGGGGGFI